MLDQFYWTAHDMEQIMVWNEENNNDPYDNAKRWVDNNPDKVQRWLAP